MLLDYFNSLGHEQNNLNEECLKGKSLFERTAKETQHELDTAFCMS